MTLKTILIMDTEDVFNLRAAPDKFVHALIMDCNSNKPRINIMGWPVVMLSPINNENNPELILTRKGIICMDENLWGPKRFAEEHPEYARELVGLMEQRLHEFKKYL